MSSKKLKVGLDVDGLLACFVCGVIKRAEQMKMEEHFPTKCTRTDYWNLSPAFSEVMRGAWKDESFWLSLPRLYNHSIKFTPDCYITSRLVPSSVTEEWLKSKGFPAAEVITVSDPSHKLKEIQKRGVDVFVDDYYVTVQQLIDNGVNAYLYKAPYQRGHKEECGHLPTIDSLEMFND